MSKCPPAREVVWEFRSPFRVGDENANLYSLERVDASQAAWLNR
jgi:hypothetical protein